MWHQTFDISQEPHITPIPIPIVYKDEQEMWYGNSGSEIVPHPQPGVPDTQGVQSEGQAGVVVEEPAEAIAPGAPEF